MVIATMIAFAIGYACIAWLLRWVANHSVYVFVWYRIGLGILVMALLSAGTLSAT